MIESPSAATITPPRRAPVRAHRLAPASSLRRRGPASAAAGASAHAIRARRPRSPTRQRRPASAGDRAEREQLTLARRLLGVHAAELAAGDVDDLAVDVVGELRAEEQHRARGLLGLGRAAERDRSSRPSRASARGCPRSTFSPLAVSIFSPFSLAWVSRVSTKPKATALQLILNWPHSLASVFVSPTTPGLGGRVVDLPGVAHRARDRGDVDELAEDLLALGLLGLGGLAPVRARSRG